MEKIYEPKDVEARRYAEWEERGYFHAEPTPGKQKYSITIPPPNVTGSLHMGHALTYTVQDTLGRWKKMCGFTVLILPGTDHAGIATQNVVEKQIAKDGLTRFDLGREKFVEKVWEWKAEYGTRIVSQLKRLGCAFDWQRERFTLDERYADAVLQAFVRFYDAGLIYKGNRLINWCPRCQTVISDIEVEEEDQAGHLWHIRYPFADGSGSMVVATSRPETMLGDSAVAVNPEDERYTALIGKMIALPLTDRQIPLIADSYASAEFGTGAVKVTPAHDPNDYEAGKRNNLAQITVIGFDGNMTAQAGERYSTLDRYEARNLVVSDLEELGLLEKVEDHPHRVPTCERCHTTIEPLLSDQWFMKMANTDLVARAIEAAEQDSIEFVPDRYKKIYLDWMNGLRDWPLSRQLWWGHRLPVYYRPDGTHVAARNWEEAVARAGTDQLTQEEDVLDTWFSSALWPFATLGWPEKTPDLEYFYPTDVLTTSREILYLWVARMIMTGIEFMGEKPFDQVYIFATVLDKKGRRMSKSLGNGVDPVEMIDKYGTDALRFSLLRLASKGQDIRFSEDRVPESRNFANKLWNAARFVLMNLDDDFSPVEWDIENPWKYTMAERSIMSKLERHIHQVPIWLNNYDLDDACNALHTFIWNEFCDWFLELSKPSLQSDNQEERRSMQNTLWTVLKTSISLLHPMMPFITEEIWQSLPYTGESITLASYPKRKQSFGIIDDEPERYIQFTKDSVSELRQLRAEFTPPGQENEVVRAAMIARRFTTQIVPDSEEFEKIIQDQLSNIVHFARLGSVEILLPSDPIDVLTVGVSVYGATYYIPSHELLEGVDIDKETLRVDKEIIKLEKEHGSLQGRLKNPQFLERALPEVVQKTYDDLYDLTQRIAKLVARREILAR